MSTPRLASAFMMTTVQSPLSTFQVRSLVVSVVIWAAQNVWSTGAAGTASPAMRRYRTRLGETSMLRT